LNSPVSLPKFRSRPRLVRILSRIPFGQQVEVKINFTQKTAMTAQRGSRGITVVVVVVVVVVVEVVVVPSGLKRPLVILLDFLSKSHWVMLSLSHFRFVVFCFPRPCRSGISSALFCVAFKISCQFIVSVPRIWSVHLFRCLPLLRGIAEIFLSPRR
jgi:hypothetical protein